MPPVGMRSNRPKAALNRASPARTSSSDAPERERERGRSGRVVDVVEAGQRAARSRSRRARRASRNRDPIEPAELDVARRDVERRPAVAAAGTAVVAEVPDVRRCELVRALRSECSTSSPRRAGGAGVPASGRRGRTGGHAPVRRRDRRPPGRLRSRRASSRRESARRRAPALGDELELAVAVELVAEEVAEQQTRAAACARAPPEARPRRPRTARARLRAPATSAEAMPGKEVRAGAVPREPVLAAEDLGRHRRRRGLAVGRRDDRDALREAERRARRRRRDRASTGASRDRGAAAAPGDAGERADARGRPTSRVRAGAPIARRA